MGDRGRLVVPAGLRSKAGWEEGTPLVLVESEQGVAFLTRDQLKVLVRADLSGADLVGELLAGRRHEAAAEDPAG